MRFATRCAAEARVIVLRVDFPLGERPPQIARRVLVEVAGTVLQVDSRLEGRSKLDAPLYTAEVEESLAIAKVEDSRLAVQRQTTAQVAMAGRADTAQGVDG
jgi:hypothetical protein